MLRFEYNTHDFDDLEFSGNSVILEWEHEEEDIRDILEKFKYFLLAKSYSSILVDRIQYLNDSQVAKLNLTDGMKK